MTRRWFLLPALVALAATLVAAGCGGGSEDSEPVATTDVTMAKSYRFDPKTIEIEAGQTVTWTNEDNFTHTVQVDDREDHKVGQGEKVSITFDTPGTYHYVCTLHRQDMDGTVTVR
jgi:plastocyanin